MRTKLGSQGRGLRTVRVVVLLVAAFWLTALVTGPASAKPMKAVTGNTVTIPPGSKVSVNGNTATIKKNNVIGNYSCICGSDADAIGCIAVQKGNNLSCDKSPISTCKGSCSLITITTGLHTSPGLTITTPGGNAGPSTSSGNAPAAR
jgi:hypothetical protein